MKGSELFSHTGVILKVIPVKIESLSTDVFEPPTSAGSLCSCFYHVLMPNSELQSSHFSIYNLTFSTKRE